MYQCNYLLQILVLKNKIDVKYMPFHLCTGKSSQTLLWFDQLWLSPPLSVNLLMCCHCCNMQQCASVAANSTKSPIISIEWNTLLMHAAMSTHWALFLYVISVLGGSWAWTFFLKTSLNLVLQVPWLPKCSALNMDWRARLLNIKTQQQIVVYLYRLSLSWIL